MLFWLRLLPYGIAALGAWYVYGWGSQVIENYGAMQRKIERLERDKSLIESRVASYQTITQRYKDAIAASQCRTRIEYLVKNPELLKKPNPFPTEGGG
jgi:hypothetical protein